MAYAGAPATSGCLDVSSPDSHGFVHIERHLVPMRDGCRLSTDVYRPAHSWDAPDEAEGARPVLLFRTPYNKAKPPRTECCLLPGGELSEPIDNTHTAERFARRGYIVVMQVRPPSRVGCLSHRPWCHACQAGLHGARAAAGHAGHWLRTRCMCSSLQLQHHQQVQARFATRVLF